MRIKQRNSSGQFIKGHTLSKGEKNPYFGKKHSKKILKKMSENSSHYWKGKNILEKTKKKISNTLKGRVSPMKGKKHSEETKYKIKLSNLGQTRSLETKRKCREAKIKYLEKCKMNGQPLSPTIGKHETKILNDLEFLFNCKIIRQYKIPSLGYFVDGYISKLNLCIEIDESHHKKLKEKDTQRQKEIEKKLNCKFLRITDY